ncbi:MAG: C40 family peptidase, partial [Bacteroidia bacterium]|nr:C40 family peptidase [Bacteroidia bacterium]
MKSQYLRSIWALVILAGLVTSCKHKEKDVKKPAPKVSSRPASSPGPKKTAGNASALEQKLGVSRKQIRENKLYAFIDDWYGTPYKYGGCQKSGVDCSCFTNVLYENVYGKKIARSAAEMFLACDQVTLEEVKQGDLMFFKIGGNKIS